MQYKEAFRLSQQVNCREALAAPLTVTSDVKPSDEIESNIMCKVKARAEKVKISAMSMAVVAVRLI